jgi:hypothetical protein
MVLRYLHLRIYFCSKNILEFQLYGIKTFSIIFILVIMLVNFDVRTHPNVIFAYSSNYTEMTIKVENTGKETCWAEADVLVPAKLSVSPDNELLKGRARVGIIGMGEQQEKSIRIYANKYSNPQIYRCDVTLYVYSKDGTIEKRVEKPIDIRCELKKDETL